MYGQDPQLDKFSAVWKQEQTILNSAPTHDCFRKQHSASQVVYPLEVRAQSLPVLHSLECEVIWQHPCPLHSLNDLIAPRRVLCPRTDL